jgi:hypothetical protein
MLYLLTHRLLKGRSDTPRDSMTSASRTATYVATTALVAGRLRVRATNPPPASSVATPMDVVAAGAYPPPPYFVLG